MYKYDSRTPGANKYVHSERERDSRSNINIDDPNLSYIPLREYDKWQALNNKKLLGTKSKYEPSYVPFRSVPEF